LLIRIVEDLYAEHRLDHQQMIGFFFKVLIISEIVSLGQKRFGKDTEYSDSDSSDYYCYFTTHTCTCISAIYRYGRRRRWRHE
jgi:hypothetical protein